jgi:hypothetical protein
LDGRPQTIIAQLISRDYQLNNQAMTMGLSKPILPICKLTSRVPIRESKQSRIHYFMHCINSKYSEKERIGDIDQGFSCLAARTAQSLPLVGLGDYPTLARLN